MGTKTRGLCLQGLPEPRSDPNILWSGVLGRPAEALYFHQVVEKEGVAVRRMVYILVIIGSPGTYHSSVYGSSWAALKRGLKIDATAAERGEPAPQLRATHPT